MNPQRKRVRPLLGKAVVLPEPTPGGKALTLPHSPASPEKLLMQQKYCELVRKHLGPMMDRLFAEFTGLHFHIAWMSPSSAGRDGQNLPSGCSVCRRLKGSLPLPNCQICGARHTAIALESDRGHWFICPLSVRNYWLPIGVRGETLGIAFLQAAARVPGVVRGRLRRAGVTVSSRSRFLRAARFLKYIVSQVETASLSDLQQADLDRAGRALVALEKEQARLHQALERYVPAAAEVSRTSGPESRAERVILGLLERIEKDLSRPVTLRQFAEELHMNAAYLSALFSRVVGIPFKTYLTDLRLQRGKGLLGDPARTTSEVAFALGYSSEGRFRFAFKKATGLSPKEWRETMWAGLAPVGPVKQNCVSGAEFRPEPSFSRARV